MCHNTKRKQQYEILLTRKPPYATHYEIIEFFHSSHRQSNNQMTTGKLLKLQFSLYKFLFTKIFRSMPNFSRPNKLGNPFHISILLLVFPRFISTKNINVKLSLVKDGSNQLDRSCEKGRNIKQS